MNSLVGYDSSDDESEARTEDLAHIPKVAPPDGALTTACIDRVPPAHPSLDRNVAIAASPLSTSLEATPTDGADAIGPQPAPIPALNPQVEQMSLRPASADDSSIDAYSFERQRLRELTMPVVPNFDIPLSPSPPPTNSEEAATLAATTKKFERFLELKRQGVHFNERLQESSSLRNPSLLSKLMDFAGISREESYESSLPEDLAVPTTWPEECYVESLLRQNERRERKRLAEREKLEFVTASSSTGSGGPAMPAGGVDDGKRSKLVKR